MMVPNMSLQTEYAGLKLKNPFIVSSSGLTDSAEKVRKMEEAGASAVVLKSLFEEQIEIYADRELQNGYDYPEAMDYMLNYIRSNQIDKYLQLIKDAKSSCSIPVIASINCHTSNTWIEFAKNIEEAGADAIEINIMTVNTEVDFKHGDVEMKYIEVLKKLKKVIHIPVIMKMAYQITNPVSLLIQLKHNGADAAVLFNRKYTPDIDIDKLVMKSSSILSSPGIFFESLRWTGIISQQVPELDLSLSGGVYDYKSVVKAILAGADTVSLCSVLYKEGLGVIEQISEEVMGWMKSHGFCKIDDFKGKMNQANINDQSFYERTQFMRYFSDNK